MGNLAIRHTALAFLVIISISFGTLPVRADERQPPRPYGRTPAVFVANAGQAASAVRFSSAGGGVPIFFTDRDAASC